MCISETQENIVVRVVGPEPDYGLHVPKDT
jgi:hypothetical protein